VLLLCDLRMWCIHVMTATHFFVLSDGPVFCLFQFDLAHCGRITKDEYFQIMCTMGDPMKPAEFERMLNMFSDAVDSKTDEVS
jgi:hypothetical protein